MLLKRTSRKVSKNSQQCKITQKVNLLKKGFNKLVWLKKCFVVVLEEEKCVGGPL